jgi:hypothetical protein
LHCATLECPAYARCLHGKEDLISEKATGKLASFSSARDESEGEECEGEESEGEEMVAAMAAVRVE